MPGDDDRAGPSGGAPSVASAPAERPRSGRQHLAVAVAAVDAVHRPR